MCSPISDTQLDERVSKKFVWQSEETQNYREEEFVRLQTGFSQVTSGQDVNENIEQFYNLMSDLCDPLFAHRKKKTLIRSTAMF